MTCYNVIVTASVVECRVRDLLPYLPWTHGGDNLSDL